MIKRIVLIKIFMVLFILNCIKDNIVDTELNPGRRDYIWTIDTIKSFNPVYRIWGSSPSDVWAISPEHIYHYDGDEWSTDGIFRFSPYSIWGFSKSNVYIGSDGGRIFHYDGSSWKQIVSLTKDGHSDIAFDNMWGDTPTNLYATGAYPDEEGYANNSVIAHFNGNKWIMQDTKEVTGIVEYLYRNKSDYLIYLQAIKLSNTYDSTFIYKYENEKYSELFRTRWADTWAGISQINGEVYFILENEIAIRKNNQFEIILNLENYNFYEKIWGRNSMDIFILMTDGLAHYNGDDIEYLFYFNNPRTQIFRAAIFKKEVFFLVDESSTGLSLIYHGKLN